MLTYAFALFPEFLSSPSCTAFPDDKKILGVFKHHARGDLECNFFSVGEEREGERRRRERRGEGGGLCVMNGLEDIY